METFVDLARQWVLAIAPALPRGATVETASVSPPSQRLLLSQKSRGISKAFSNFLHYGLSKYTFGPVPIGNSLTNKQTTPFLCSDQGDYSDGQ